MVRRKLAGWKPEDNPKAAWAADRGNISRLRPYRTGPLSTPIDTATRLQLGIRGTRHDGSHFGLRHDSSDGYSRIDNNHLYRLSKDASAELIPLLATKDRRRKPRPNRQ